MRGTEFTDREIKEGWEFNGNVQRSRGTLMHWHIEQRLNGRHILPPHSTEFQMFFNFAKDWLWGKGRQVYRTEANLYHIGLSVAGQADLICVEGDGTLSIFDWKRTREIKRTNRYEKMKPPLDDFQDCNYLHYCLQLNLYRYIIESEYERTVSLMYLVILHPSQLAYEVIPVPQMGEEINKVVDYLIAQGQAGEPVPGNVASPFSRKRARSEIVNLDRLPPISKAPSCCFY